MTEIFVHQDHARVGFYKTVLEDAGIPCFIRGEYGNTSLASQKSTFFAPALCVLNEEDADRAKAILAEIENAPVTKERDWICPSCQEAVPANFDTCWKCGANRPSAAPSGA